MAESRSALWPFLRSFLRPRGFDLGGKWGERLAASHLEGLGYTIQAVNYRVRGGEADLIATKDDLVVVVEVKSRRSRRFGTAAQAVTLRKARRVLLAGRAYCRRHGISLSKLRGDVITVEAGPDLPTPRTRLWEGGLRDR